MVDLIVFSAPQQVNERSSLTVTARFRDRAAFAAVTPTNVYWRLDGDDGSQLADWTSISPDAEVSIAIAADLNRICRGNLPSEGKVLTVMADRGLSTQFANAYRYTVQNLPWHGT